MDEMEFTFEQLPITDSGIMAWGVATLETCGPDYPGEFYVSWIELDGGTKLNPSSLPRGTFGRFIFDTIAEVIQDDKTPNGLAAAKEWAARLDEESAPKPFKRRIYDATREEPVMGASLAHV